MDYVDFLHGGNIYEIEKRHKIDIIDFSANINPLGLPKTIKKAIYNNLNRILHYPDPEARTLIQKIAKYWGIDKENVLVGNGSIELIYLILSSYRPKSTVIAVPTFSEYERAAKSVNSRIQFLRLKENEGFRFNISPSTFLEGIDKSDILFLCNPNNPTGNIILPSPNEIASLTSFARNDSSKIVVDEAFMDFLPNEKDYTLIWKAIKDKRIIVIRTFTKFFTLPGLRMGYVVAHKKIIDKLKENQSPWNTNCLAQITGELILSDKEYIRKTYKLIEKERRFLFRELAKIDGLKVFPSVTNFLLIKIEKKTMVSGSLKGLLIRRGILIRDCANFRNLNNRYIRVAIRSHRENLQLVSALKEAI